MPHLQFDINKKLSKDSKKHFINFVEESGEMGSANFIENDTYFKFNENNYLTFKTRRNKKGTRDNTRVTNKYCHK